MCFKTCQNVIISFKSLTVFFIAFRIIIVTINVSEQIAQQFQKDTIQVEKIQRRDRDLFKIKECLPPKECLRKQGLPSKQNRKLLYDFQCQTQEPSKQGRRSIVQNKSDEVSLQATDSYLAEQLVKGYYHFEQFACIQRKMMINK